MPYFVMVLRCVCGGGVAGCLTLSLLSVTHPLLLFMWEAHAVLCFGQCAELEEQSSFGGSSFFHSLAR